MAIVRGCVIMSIDLRLDFVWKILVTWRILLTQSELALVLRSFTNEQVSLVPQSLSLPPPHHHPHSL